MNFQNKLRARWAMLTKALGFSDALTEHIYRIYLNHSKIVHYRDGYPVYSLSTPAMYSPASAHFIARLMYRVIQNRPIPNLMSFAITDRCNAKCEHCSFFTSLDDPTRSVLTLDECKRVIAEAQELGVTVINFVGGEPLLRPDLPEMLRSIDKRVSISTLFTNGGLLKDKAAELARAGLDGIYVSIDAADAETHDRKRGVKIFDAALEGIRAALKTRMSVGISATIGPEDFKRGELERIIELGKKLGVHEIVVFDALPAGKLKDRDDLRGARAWVDDMIRSVESYNRRPDYPGIIFYAYASSHRSVGCSCGVSYFYISPYGDIHPCDFYHRSFGNVREEPIYRLWEHLSQAPSFGSAKWGGCRVAEAAASPTASTTPTEDKTLPAAGCATCTIDCPLRH